VVDRKIGLAHLVPTRAREPEQPLDEIWRDARSSVYIGMSLDIAFRLRRREASRA